MTITVHAPDGVPEVRPGDDLRALLLSSLGPGWTLADGDVVAVTSKVVSKAEGRLRAGDRHNALLEETVRIVARRAETVIVRNRLGLTMAAAGIDASNVPSGQIALLPVDPDASARALRAALLERAGANVAVVVTDTSGRAWREGQTDIAVGAAGLVVLDDHRGRVDPHGHALAVTAPAVADEVAGAAELAQGKLAGRPFAVLRGLQRFVLPAGDDGPGAGALVRAEAGDLFGYGAREAVVQAVLGDPASLGGFGAAASGDELAGHLEAAFPGLRVDVGAGEIAVHDDDPRVAVVTHACGWERIPGADLDVGHRWRPVVP